MGTTKNVKTFINKADCVVLPSYREGTPKTLLEAASLAKPIVTTNVPGCNNIVRNGKNGFLCERKNAADLALSMKKMINLSNDERTRMSNYSRKYVKLKFDEKIVINKYISTINNIN